MATQQDALQLAIDKHWDKNKSVYYPLGKPVDCYQDTIIGKETMVEIFQAGWQAAMSKIGGGE